MSAEANRFAAFSERERALLALSLTASCVLATLEGEKHAARMVLEVTPLIDELAETVGLDPVNPELLALVREKIQA